jgi:preprotein translocase subunit YajC
METNWIILALVLVFAIVLIIFLVIRNAKDKDEVISSFNTETDLTNETDREKDDE